jgi:hypothetical protein
MISIICFSKDRPLQLEGYIQSVLFYSGLPPQALSILYADSPTTSYSALVQKYPLVNWVRETQFHADLSRLVAAAHDYVLLGCDDVFFTDHFDPSIPLKMLAKDSDLFGFSLRLGLNLHWLPKLRLDGNVAQWEWRTAPAGNWDYPWDVSASIYRREFIANYLHATPAAINPNRFEGFLADSCLDDARAIGSKLACFKRSKCLTLTVNRVQDEFPNEFDDSAETDIASLYRAHISGQQLDWPSFYQAENRLIHVDSKYFRTSDIIMPPDIAKGGKQTGLIECFASSLRLRFRLVFWRYFFKFKLALRPWIPHRVMALMRKLVRIS